MKQARSGIVGRTAAAFALVAVALNALAPVAMAQGARDGAAIAADAFGEAICHGGAAGETPASHGGGPALHCPLCPGPAAAALQPPTPALPPALGPHAAASFAAVTARTEAFDPPSRHRPRAPPLPA